MESSTGLAIVDTNGGGKGWVAVAFSCLADLG